MATIEMPCGITSCPFVAKHADKDLVLAIYTSHQRMHEPVLPTTIRQDGRAPKMERPKISAGCSEETWNTFLVRWRNYKRTSGIPDTSITGELFACCDEDVGDDIIKHDSGLLEGTEDNLLKALKRLTVIPVALCVRRSELLQLRQDHGETARLFYSRVKGKADTCGFQIKCTQSGCPGGDVDYTDNMIKTVLTSGLYDPDIQRGSRLVGS